MHVVDPKDPDAVLDYTFDWTDWLEDGDTIATFNVALDAPPDSVLVVNSDDILTGATGVVAWLSGGTLGQLYPVRCRITTLHDRTDDRTMLVPVRQQ